jgi:hypothetical protein
MAHDKEGMLPSTPFEHWASLSLFFLFLVGLGFELRASHFKAGILLLEPHL